MKIIIAGSRTITDFAILLRAISRARGTVNLTVQDEIVSGCAKGVDQLGEMYADTFMKSPGNVQLKLKKFPANWDKYGKKAGYVRNIAMAEYADALIAVWDGKSKGTKMMIDIAKKKGLKVFVYNLREIKDDSKRID